MLFFTSCLSSITISNELTTISDYVFLECPSLSSISISDKVTEISVNGLDNYYSLIRIEVDSSVTQIEEEVFSQGSSL